MTDSGGPRLSDLPDELWIMIASHLEPSDRASLAQCAKNFRYVMDYGELRFDGHDRNSNEKFQCFVRFFAYAVTGSLSFLCMPLSAFVTLIVVGL